MFQDGRFLVTKPKKILQLTFIVGNMIRGPRLESVAGADGVLLNSDGFQLAWAEVTIVLGT